MSNLTAVFNNSTRDRMIGLVQAENMFAIGELRSYAGQFMRENKDERVLNGYDLVSFDMFTMDISNSTGHLIEVTVSFWYDLDGSESACELRFDNLDLNAEIAFYCDVA